MSKNKKLTTKEYEDLGRIVASVYESGYLDAAKSYRTAFLKGIVQGFGGVIGATLVVALLLWLLSLLGSIPFLGEVIDSIEQSINASSVL